MTTTTHTPRFALGDLVQVVGTGSQHTYWSVEAIEPATDTQPTGYRLRRANGHSRTVDEDKLVAAGEGK